MVEQLLNVDRGLDLLDIALLVLDVQRVKKVSGKHRLGPDDQVGSGTDRRGLARERLEPRVVRGTLLGRPVVLVVLRDIALDDRDADAEPGLGAGPQDPGALCRRWRPPPTPIIAGRKRRVQIASAAIPVHIAARNDTP